MKFSKFSIKNFKSFKDEQILYFAEPRSGQIGSGLTYIVGANNSGKTTLIESLSIKKNHRLKDSERLLGSDPEFKLFDGEELKRYCHILRPESYTIEESPILNDTDRFEIISSRRHWSNKAGSTYGEVGASLTSSFELNNRQNQVAVASELKVIESDTTKYNEFINLVQRVIPEFTRFAVGYENEEYIQYISASGIRHKVDLLGDGVITVIRILLHIYVNKYNPLVIDEPELSLHPAAQKRLLKVLAEYSQHRQIIISTHSPYLVNWQYLQNGAVINRIIKHNDLQSEIYSIKDFSSYSGLISSANWKQPFLLDEVAKEILFTEDNILFLEGQEDVGLLRNEPLVQDFNIFGYGVRGRGNFKFALKLAHDLGFKKVSCILDAGVAESEIKQRLESEFPHYKIIQWDRRDIRDKSQLISNSKVGYFDEHGNKKTDIGDFDEKLTQVKTYLSS